MSEDEGEAKRYDIDDYMIPDGGTNDDDDDRGHQAGDVVIPEHSSGSAESVVTKPRDTHVASDNHGHVAIPGFLMAGLVGATDIDGELEATLRQLEITESPSENVMNDPVDQSFHLLHEFLDDDHPGDDSKLGGGEEDVVEEDVFSVLGGTISAAHFDQSANHGDAPTHNSHHVVKHMRLEDVEVSDSEESDEDSDDGDSSRGAMMASVSSESKIPWEDMVTDRHREQGGISPLPPSPHRHRVTHIEAMHMDVSSESDND